jgi:hypothetical protein
VTMIAYDSRAPKAHGGETTGLEVIALERIFGRDRTGSRWCFEWESKCHLIRDNRPIRYPEFSHEKDSQTDSRESKRGNQSSQLRDREIPGREWISRFLSRGVKTSLINDRSRGGFRHKGRQDRRWKFVRIISKEKCHLVDDNMFLMCFVSGERTCSIENCHVGNRCDHPRERWRFFEILPAMPSSRACCVEKLWTHITPRTPCELIDSWYLSPQNSDWVHDQR